MNTPPRVSDVCLVTRDLDAAVDFYTTKLGYRVDSRMPGFADFHGNGLVLAVWDATKIRETTGVSADTIGNAGHQVMLACELDSPELVDEMYETLVAQGVDCYAPPKDYPWNARCIYFGGPCGEFWEFFAWYDGGKPGQVDK